MSVFDKGAEYRPWVEHYEIIQKARRAMAAIDWQRFIDAYAEQVSKWQSQFGTSEQIKQHLKDSRKLVFDHWHSSYLSKCEKAARKQFIVAHEVSVIARHVLDSSSPYDFIAEYPFSSSELIAPVYIGEYLGKVDLLQLWIEDFDKLELPAPEPKLPTPAKGTPADLVRRYFPHVATIHGSAATNANALHQLAVWLLHWAERHGCDPASDEYSLAGQLCKQQAAHTNIGKFLKACQRLHGALLPLVANEQTVEKLLGDEYGLNSYHNLATVLNWWAGWIKKQRTAHDDPAGAYLTALRWIPVTEERDSNGSPRYTIAARLIDSVDFDGEVAPLRQAFEDALPNLPAEKKGILTRQLNELLSINQASVKRRRKQFERGEYGLNFLPADYPALRFDVAGQIGTFKWQWVGPLFWGGLATLLQYKQVAARVAYEQLVATLPEATRLVEANSLGTSANNQQSIRPEYQSDDDQGDTSYFDFADPTDSREHWRQQFINQVIDGNIKTACLNQADARLISSYRGLLNDFYYTWRQSNTGQINFDNEVIRLSKLTKRLFNSFPDDIAELADGLCLSIRFALVEMTDTFTGRWTRAHEEGRNKPPMDISDPSYTAWLTEWMNEQRHEEETAIKELLYGRQLPMPPITDEIACAKHNTRLAFRHQFLATVNLYQYVREFYEKHLPKQFPRRVALPSYLTSPSVSPTQLNSTVISAQQPNARRTAGVKKLADWSVLLTGLDEEALRAVASEMGLFGDEVIPARAWSGLVLELKERHYLPDDANTEALVKAFAAWGITVTPNSIRTPAKTAIEWQRKANKAFKTVLKQQIL